MNQRLTTIQAIGICLMSLFLATPSIAQYNWGSTNTVINSGDPVYPFPQFTDYEAGATLGRNNAEGVTDCEMEQTTREAYQIMMNRAEHTGVTVAGTQYIRFNGASFPDTGPEPDVSEGDGYALLAAAYMADKPTFDGLWMYVHDNKMSVDEMYQAPCAMRNAGYEYGDGTIGWRAGGTVGSGDADAAADGDFDIALALVIAAHNWPTGGITDGCAGFHSYKDIAISYLKTISDTLFYDVNDGTTNRDLTSCSPGTDGWYSGDIGFDGYIKSGNTWAEVTNWGQGYTYNGQTFCPRSSGAASHHIDYAAPSYFHAFAAFLQAENPVLYDWNIHQFLRAEASSDWLMGEINAQGLYPTVGGFSVAGTTASFNDDNFAEDARCPWRTILNYVWHGNPTTSWDPNTHEVVAGGNTYEYDNAMQFADLIDFDTECAKLGNDPTDLEFSGTALMTDEITRTGTIAPGVGKHINFNNGSGSPSAVAHAFNTGDMDLVAKMYRQAELQWDASGNNAMTDPDDRYINSLPKYFHGWFRVLPLLVLTGNYHSPEFYMQAPQANMKVYKSVDKTFAFTGDQITYTFDYRNFASVAANDVQITFDVPSDATIVNPGGGSVAGNTVTWNIGTVPGVTTASGPQTGSVALTIQVNDNAPNQQFCNQATITTSNGTGFTSNEYPNNCTATMERNCVDIITRSLEISKTANRTDMNPGDEIEFTLDFENSTTGGWLNGGRSGIRLTYGNGYSGPNTFVNYFRLLHGADEAYIDPGNYRASYFLNDPARIGLYDAATNPGGWVLETTIMEGGDPTKVVLSSETIPYGSDANGDWNQRMIIRFADSLMATTQHVNNYFGVTKSVHKGIAEPFRMAVKMETNPSIPMAGQVADDWSYSSAIDVGSNDKSMFTPVSPSWFDPLSTYNAALAQTITDYHPEACNPSVTQVYERILVEEFDGYTWRRVLGNGPLPGREITNVVVRDTIPAGLTFDRFEDDEALGVTATLINSGGYEIIEWTIPSMLPGAAGNLSYVATADGACPMSDLNETNYAWIYSDTDSPLSSEFDYRVTCDFVPPPLEATTMTKTADKANYSIGETINYTIDLEQTQGTIAIDDATSNADWTNIAGSWSGGSTGWSSPIQFFTQNYSHGTDGELRATIDLNGNGWENFSLIFRHVSGTPGTAGFDGVALNIWPGPQGIGAGINVSAMDGNTLIRRDGTAGAPISITPPGDPIEVIVRLSGDTMAVWFNNDPDLSPATVTYTGLREQAGYVGYYNGKTDGGMGGGDNGSRTITNWESHFDSAFDLQVSDPIPAEVSFVSSPTGTNNAGTVEWPLIPGPVLAGTTFQYTWQGTVDACGGSGNIVNVAYANMYGQPTNSIGAQEIVGCNGGGPTCTDPVSASISPTGPIDLCSGDSQTLTATVGTATAPVGNWNYEFFLGGVSQQSGASNTFNATAAGSYTVEITDDADAATCSATSTAVTVNVTGPTTTAVAGTDQTICETGTATLSGNAAGGGETGTWTTAGDGTFSNANDEAATYTPGTNDITTGTVTLTWTIDDGVCTPTADNVTITIDPTPTASVAGPDQNICADNTTLAGNTPTSGTGQWTQTVGTGTITTDTDENTTVTGLSTGTNTFVWTITSGACGTSTDEVDITVTGGLTTADAGTDQNICTTSTTLAGNAASGGETGTWTIVSGGAGASITTPTDEGTTVTSLPVGTTTLRWTIDNGVCTPSTDEVDIVVTGSATAANAGTDQSICETGTATLAANAAGGGETGTWTTSGDGTFSNANDEAATYTPGTNDITTGTVTLTWTIDNGVCTPTADNVTITIDPTPTTANAGTDQTICADNTTLAGNLPTNGTGQWTQTAGTGTITTDTDENTTVTTLSTGTNTFVWTITSGACGTSTDAVDITVTGGITTAAAGTDQTICETGTATLAANAAAGGETGTWTTAGDGTFSNANDEAATYTPGTNDITTGTVTLTWTIDNGVCTPTADNVTITIDPTPTTANAGTDQTICGDNTTLNGNTPTNGTGQWTQTAGTGTITTDTDENTTVTTLSTGTNTFVWTITSGACGTSTDAVDITAEAPPTTADAGSAQTVCADNTTLSATAATIGTGTWTVISGSGTFGNANDEGTTVTGLTAGANVFRWTTSNGSCPTSTDEVTITSEQVPTTAAAGTDQTLCADNTTLNGNSPTIGTGQWTLISGTATITTDTDENTTVTGIAVGTTVLRWTISNGSCPASTDEVTITRTGSAAADVQISPTNPATVCASIDQTFQAIPTNEGATPTYYWYVNGILQPEDQDTLTRTFTNGETVQVAMKSSLGCASPDSASSTLVNITTDDPPTTADAGTDQNICADNTGLTANTAVSGTGQWNILQGPVTVGTNTDPTTTISGIGAGSTVILEWAITNGTCPTSRDTVEITRSGTVTTAAAGTDQTICETGTATLAANAAGAGETGMWTTTGDGSFSNANDETATYTPGATDITNGTVTLQWEIDNGLCTPSTDQITITIDPTPTTAAAGPDQNICANNATLAANTPTSGTGQWTQTAGSGTITTATDENTTVTTLGTGTNTFVWTITSGACGTSTDEVDITVTGGITTADANIDQTICETSTATLAANAVATGETGTWTTAGDGSFSNANDEGATYTPGTTDITNGTVTLQWEIDNGVCTPSTDQITITIDQSPSAAVAGADQSICSGTATMSATAPAVGTGTWTTSGDGTFSSANDEAATYTPGTSDIATGTATLTWTVSNGVCADNTDNMVLTITSGAAADVTISSDVDTICFGMTTATFTATPANGGATPNYDWYANGTIAQSGPTNTFSSSTLLHGTYVRVELTSSLACVSPSTATDSMQIFSLNDPTPVLTTTGSIDICDNETTTLTGFGSGGSLQWYELSSGPIAGATSSSYTTSTSGQYYLEEDNGVCPASTSDTVTLNVNATPVVSAGPDQQIDLGTSTILNGSASTGTITWTPSITLDDATIQTPTASPISQTTYTITVVNGGCTASDQVTITVTEPIVVPNVFTPNADNDNDQWVISGLTSYPEAELEIFNRWGMPVYKSQGTVVPWDGTRDGEQMPVATYYYILKLNATAEPMTGSVTLVR